MYEKFQISEISPERQAPGLRLALRDLDETQFRTQVDALREAENAELPAHTRLWGLFHEGNLAGAVLVQIQPGRSAMVWPPRIIDGQPRQAAAQLLEAGLRALGQADLGIAQALLPTDAGGDADMIRAAGFRHVSDLLYLVCPAHGFPDVQPSSMLQFSPIGADHERRFAALVEATYEGTLDCPAVNGLRSMEDVLQGYRATGKYDPAWWLVVHRQGEAIGCLIVSDYPQYDTCELIYMGLVPAARRQGFGAAITGQAMWLAATARRQRLVVAVDAANTPAVKMYAAAGFQAWDRKSVFLRVM
jgi:ribosomal protein S18 acetylase RimI-like enzyme